MFTVALYSAVLIAHFLNIFQISIIKNMLIEVNCNLGKAKEVD